MEEATGAPSSLAVCYPKRLRASGRDRETVMTEPPSPLTMLFSRHTRRREFITLSAARRRRGRSRRGRSRLTGCAASACSWARARTRSEKAKARRRSFPRKVCKNWAGAIGRNVQIDYRSGPRQCRTIFAEHAAELAALAPDVILASGGPVVGRLLQATRTVPVVFVSPVDPVGCRLCCQSGAAGRQRHRICHARIQHHCKMAGVA